MEIEDKPVVEFVEVNRKDIIYSESSPLTKATSTRPVFVREGSQKIRIYPPPEDAATVVVYYWKRPTHPNWGYVVAAQKALYNFNTSVNFELHPCEEERLVGRILALAGVAIKDMELAQIASHDNVSSIKLQND